VTQRPIARLETLGHAGLDGSVTVGGATLLRGRSPGSIIRRAQARAPSPPFQPGGLIQHGPFVAGSEQEIIRLFQEFRAGAFTPISRLTPVR